MTVKSIQTLVSEAMQEIKTINADDAHKMLEDNECNLIDIREAKELEKTGSVENSVHISRGMLEVFLDPNSVYFQKEKLDKNKEMVLFCAGGVRSALAVKALKNMGYDKVSHIDGGFGAISQSKFKII
jgi:rhodanese-related sulfurtransferase